MDPPEMLAPRIEYHARRHDQQSVARELAKSRAIFENMEERGFPPADLLAALDCVRRLTESQARISALLRDTIPKSEFLRAFNAVWAVVASHIPDPDLRQTIRNEILQIGIDDGTGDAAA